MKNILPCLIFSLLFFACQNEPKQAPVDPDVLVLETLTVEKSSGDCEDPEAPCANISLRYPSVKSGKEKLKNSVADWSNIFLVALLDPVLEDDDEITLDNAINGFIEMHQEVVTDMPDLPSQYEVEVRDTLLFQDEKYLTLRLDGYSFTGGAHPNAFASIGTFDLETGELLELGDLVEDLEKLEVLAEEHFRKERADVFEEGFDFDEGWPFALTENVGLTTEGLFFCYVPYEVTPYVLGFTEFVIPFEKIEQLKMEGQ